MFQNSNERMEYVHITTNESGRADVGRQPTYVARHLVALEAIPLFGPAPGSMDVLEPVCAVLVPWANQ